MYQLTKDANIIRCLETSADIPRGHRFWDEYEVWLSEGNTPEPIPPLFIPYTPEHFRYIRDQAWAWMNQWVQDRRYDSIENCVSYANSAMPRFKAEALAMIAWRDAVSMALEAMVADPPAGLTEWEDVKARLPQPQSFNWPDLLEIPMDNPGEAIQLP